MVCFNQQLEKFSVYRGERVKNFIKKGKNSNEKGKNCVQRTFQQKTSFLGNELEFKSWGKSFLKKNWNFAIFENSWRKIKR